MLIAAINILIVIVTLMMLLFVKFNVNFEHIIAITSVLSVMIGLLTIFGILIS